MKTFEQFVREEYNKSIIKESVLDNNVTLEDEAYAEFDEIMDDILDMKETEVVELLQELDHKNIIVIPKSINNYDDILAELKNGQDEYSLNVRNFLFKTKNEDMGDFVEDLRKNVNMWLK